MTEQGLLDILAGIGLAQAKTEAVMAELGSAQAAAQVKADFETTELKKIVAESTRKFELLSIKLEGLSDNIGYASEDFFFNTLEETPVIGGVKFDRANPKVLIGPKGKKTELDIVLVNGSAVAFVEVKHRPHISHIEQIESHVAKYRTHFPEHKDYKIYAGIAGMSMPQHVIEAAQERGLFVLQQVGRALEVNAEQMRAH